MMKKYLAICLALMMLMITACSNSAKKEEASEAVTPEAPVSEAGGEAAGDEAASDEAAGDETASDEASAAEESTTISDVSEAKMMGDILGLPTPATSALEEYYVHAFELNGKLYRAVAQISKEVSDQIFDLEFDDPEYDAKLNAILAPIAIEQIDDLGAMVPPQEELDAFVGKTVGELMDEGWTYTWGYNLEEKTIGMDYGLFSYSVGYDGELDTSKELEEDDFRPLAVTSVAYEGLGNITADLE